MTDLIKLTPAPWHAVVLPDGMINEWMVRFASVENPCIPCDSTVLDKAHAEFIALARNAFDVMMRRGWTIHKDERTGGWFPVEVVGGHSPIRLLRWEHHPIHHPFEALVEADRWLAEQEAAK